MATDESSAGTAVRLQRPVDPARDHVRGGRAPDVITVVAYADLLCPYCQRLRRVMLRLRAALGDRLAYVFRHFPNERAHPGAERIARATEAAANQGRFWEMHDWAYDSTAPITEERILAFASSLGLDMPRFTADLASEAVQARVAQDLTDGRHNGVAGTPTLFVDGIRYDGAWDFQSMLEGLERPVAARVQRSARVFASLPASGGLVLLLSAILALVCANTPLRLRYDALMHASFSIGPSGGLALTVAQWCAEGLMTLFFLLVGLEIRREATAGALAERRAAVLPVIAAVGGVLAPAAIYLLVNRGPTSHGWSIPTATDVAFTLGILALIGERSPPGLRVFVAALAVVDDILSLLTLAIFYPHNFSLGWLSASVLAMVLLFVLNRWRVYAIWPYVTASSLLWLALHAAGVDAALTGVALAMLLPARPAPAASVLLAQAATALAALEHAESEAKQAGRDEPRLEQLPIWDWASRNLSAASARLLSPADRVALAVGPWSTYFVLPLFAFSAIGVPLSIDLSQPGTPRILFGVVLGLVLGKPLGVLVASWLAIKSRIAVAPDGVTPRQFIGAAILCGVGDTVALLMADQAFPAGNAAATAKIGVLLGSVAAGLLGALVLVTGSRAAARSPASDS
ncbi:MAG: Na+:H+ antiporter, NhaA family [Myxococcales bacterium]|nr:Na+:H+ antiporter, NhaA family [Myxococcales bacterium]